MNKCWEQSWWSIENIDNILQKIALYKYIDMANKGNWWRKELAKISKWLSNEERDKIIDTEYPYVKTKQRYIEHLKEKYYPKIPLEKYIKAIQNKIFSLFIDEETFTRFLSDNNIAISKEDKLMIKQFVTKTNSLKLLNILSQWTTQNKELFNSIIKIPMAIQSTLTSCITWILQEYDRENTDFEKTKQLISKWISDPETERTIPNAKWKIEQTIKALSTENIVCFCCPDYPGNFVDGTSVWRYNMESWEIWDEIWFFGWKVFQIISEVGKDIKDTYNKLKYIDIIMPSYQFFQSPKYKDTTDIEQQYNEFVKKITTTWNKLKKKIDQYFIENNIKWITINIRISSTIYSDQEIIDMKSMLQKTVSETITNSEILRKEHKKLLKYEEATGNIDTNDELISYLAEWYLLEKNYDKNTLLLVPESPQMPKLIVELEEILSNKEKTIWLPTLIIQKDRRFDV